MLFRLYNNALKSLPLMTKKKINQKKPQNKEKDIHEQYKNSISSL